MPQPLVSVVTPCLNAARFIEKTIQSVLDQDYAPLEYIVMDGGSTDGTLEILDRYRGRLQYFSAPDAGVADAVNRGFLKARGAIFAWLSADDLYYPGAIRAAVAHLEAHPEAAAIYGQANWIDARDMPLGRYPAVVPYRREVLERECCICQPACFMRRQAFKSIEMLNTRLRFTFDYDLWIRLARRHGLVAVDDLLAMSRMHPSNLTLSRRRETLEETMQLLQHHYEYVPLSWIYCYLSFLRDGRDQFFQPLQGSITVFFWSFFAGNYYNFKHPWRFWREWFPKIALGLRKIRPAAASLVLDATSRRAPAGETNPDLNSPTAFISVVVVTHNPNRELLAATLDSIERQDLPAGQFEVIVVDNASSPALTQEDFADRVSPPRLAAEPNLGLIHGRCAGIEAASGDLLVFVDDDNQIAGDYLAQTIRIARQHPDIGAFGGRSDPVFSSPPAKWKSQLLPYLGIRNHGPQPITSNCGDWGPWDPIGAGMVIRAEVARRFVDFVRKNEAALRLGRAGKSMMSAEDTLMARMAWKMSYACSYQPSLRLLHHIKPERLRLRALVRTLTGHGRSYIVLEEVLGRVSEQPLCLLPMELLASYLARVRAEGVRAGSVVWLWDLGRARELLAQRKRKKTRTRPAGERRTMIHHPPEGEVE